MIYLYENITPNRGQNTHYVFTTLSNYVTALGTAAKDFPEKSYEINSGVCRIFYTKAEEPALHVHAITYLRHVYTDTNNKTVTTFYHVTRGEMEAGYIRLYLAPDLWATNYLAAGKSNLFVENCSKSLDLAATYPDATHLKSESVSNLTNISPAFLANSASLSIVYKTVLSYSTASYVRLFANPLNRICSNNTNDNYSFQKITRLIGGIFKETGSAQDAVVTNAWIVPTAALSGDDVSGIPEILENATHTNLDQSDKYVYAKLLLKPNIFSYSRTYNVNDRTPGNIDYVGTLYKRVKLPRVNSSGEVNIKWLFITTMGEIQVLLQVGDQLTDFTDQFELELTTTNGGITATERTRRTIQTVGSLISGAIGVASMATGNPFGLMAAMAGFGTTAASAAVKPSAGMPNSSGGDAATVFYNGTYYNYPFKMITFSTAESIDKKAAYSGIEYRTYYIPSGSDPFVEIASKAGASIDSGGNEIASPQGYFIKGQICISDVQSDAAEFIEGELAGGIYIKAV